MSVVAAWWSPPAAVMAADRCMVFGGKEMMSSDNKVLVLSGADGNALLGIAGYMDYADWWRETYYVPPGSSLTREINKERSCYEIVKDQLRAFVETMRARGDGRVDDDKWHLGFEGLLACRDGLFYLYGDGSMARSPVSYGAIGTGAEVAMGALHLQYHHGIRASLEHPGIGRGHAVQRSVEAANAHARGCGFGVRLHAVSEAEGGRWEDEE